MFSLLVFIFWDSCSRIGNCLKLHCIFVRHSTLKEDSSSKLSHYSWSVSFKQEGPFSWIKTVSKAQGWHWSVLFYLYALAVCDPCKSRLHKCVGVQSKYMHSLATVIQKWCPSRSESQHQHAGKARMCPSIDLSNWEDAGRKGEVDMKSNCRSDNITRRRRKFVTCVRVFAKIYNLRRGIMTELRK